MSKKKQSAVDDYLAEQAKYQDSPYSKFFQNFSLNWILKKLNDKQKEKFLQLLKEERNGELLEFIGKNIKNFDQKITQAVKKEIKKIKHEPRKINRNND